MNRLEQCSQAYFSLPDSFRRELAFREVRVYLKAKEVVQRKGKRLYRYYVDFDSKDHPLGKTSGHLETSHNFRLHESYVLKGKFEKRPESYVFIPVKTGAVLEGSRPLFEDSSCPNGFNRVLMERLEKELGSDLSRQLLEDNPEHIKHQRLLPSHMVEAARSYVLLTGYATSVMEILDGDLSFLGLREEEKISIAVSKHRTELLLAEPWLLSLTGLFSFDEADEVAKVLGLNLLNLSRFRAWVETIFNQHAITKGQTYMAVGEAFERLRSEPTKKAYQNLPKDVRNDFEHYFRESFKELLNEGNLVRCEKLFTTREIQKREEVVARKLLKRSELRLNEFKGSSEPLLFGLSAEQKQAVELFRKSPVMLLTGVPGGGKTTVVKSALLYAGAKQENTILLAPTAKAASELASKTGFTKTGTIHQRLLLNPITGVCEGSEIEEDFVVIDECSMLTLDVLEALLDKLSNRSRVLFVGDPEQLPPIGLGKVFQDMLDSRALPTVKLTKVFRQGEGSLIAENAKRIREGQVHLLEDEDFKLLERKEEEAIKKTLALYEEAIKKYGENEVVVLMAHRQAAHKGVDYINPKLQSALHRMKGLDPTSLSYVKVYGKRFYVGDTLLNSKNAYYKRKDKTKVFMANGDKGTITFTSRFGATLQFGDQELELSLDELKNFQLSQAMSIHKSQGSEYKHVILCLPEDTSSYFFLDRNAVYTAITRAKENFAYVGRKTTLERLLERQESNKRLTGLRKEMQELKDEE